MNICCICLIVEIKYVQISCLSYVPTVSAALCVFRCSCLEIIYPSMHIYYCLRLISLHFGVSLSPYFVYLL